MDDQVMRAIQRWPDVPAAFGWLRLDRRGRWFLVDRNKPGFNEALDGPGSLISSDPIIEFICRNYLNDSAGRWYWQNGPQKAYVDIESAPLVLRVVQASDEQCAADHSLVTHTGYAVSEVTTAHVGQDQALYLQTDLGPACLHDLDLSAIDIDETSVGVAGRRLTLNYLQVPAGQALGFEARPRAVAT